MLSGRYFAEGFAIGIEQYSDEAAKVARDMGMDTLNSMNSAVAKAAGIMDGLDYNPTITPVLDLTQFQNGVGLMNGMLSTNRAVGLATYATGPTYVDQNQILANQIDAALQRAVNNIAEETSKTSNHDVFKIEVPLVIDGKVLARTTAQYTRAELNRLDNIQLRKAGIVST